MRWHVLFTCAAMLMLMQCQPNDKPDPPLVAEIHPVVDTYFGVTVTDPYRYMEDLDDPDVLTWLHSQSSYSRAVLDRIPGRERMIDRFKEFDRRKSGVIRWVHITENDRYFYVRTEPEDESGKLYYRAGYTGKEILLFDPQTYRPADSADYAITDFQPSLRGEQVAFEVAPDGSESTTLLIMNVKEKTLYPETIDRCWFASPSWLPGGKQFFYARLRSGDVHDMEREMDSQAWLHTVGTDPSEDREVFSRTACPELGIDPEEFVLVEYHAQSANMFALAVTTDRRMKVFHAPERDLQNGNIVWRPLFTLEDEVYEFDVTADDLYVYTPTGAPHFQLLKMPLSKPDLEHAEVFIPEDPHAILREWEQTSDGVYYVLSTNGIQERLYFKAYDASPPEELSLPFPAGTISLETIDTGHPKIWATLSGWTHDDARYRYVLETGTFIPENLNANPDYPEFADLIVEELMVPSHDGVRVPLSLVYSSQLERDESNPTLLIGYGAYGYSLSPNFLPEMLVWALEGGVLAFAHVRGGGELGEQWHRAGYKSTKPNSWKDAISCAEYLIAQKYTSSSRLAVVGASAGGIVVGRAVTERPDLFAAAIPRVGVMNPLRDEASPNGPVNTPEFGTINDSTECMALLEMDAYQHIQDGRAYPAALVQAGMNDPRVIAWQPAKFAARLQAASTSGKPVLLAVDYRGGHGFGSTKSGWMGQLADSFSFALWQTGHQDYQLNW